MSRIISKADRLARIAQLEREIRLSVLRELAARLLLEFAEDDVFDDLELSLAKISKDWEKDLS